VVTGTLPAGTVRAGDELLLTPGLRPVRVRAIESMGQPAGQVHGVARVALNLRGVARDIPARGMALVTPGRWTLTSIVDVRYVPPAAGPQEAPRLPRELAVHVGSARTMAGVRVLGLAGGAALAVRLALRDPLPLHVGDRVLLRDPGAAALLILGATVLDAAPPPLGRRGAAAAAARELARWPDPPRPADLLRRHGLLRTGALAAMGVTGAPEPVVADWSADPAYWSAARERLVTAVGEHAAKDPLALGLTVEAARAALGLPDRRLAEALAGTAPSVVLREGYLRPAASGERLAGSSARQGSLGKNGDASPVPEPLLRAVRAVRQELAGDPFRAPEAERLRELGLDARSIAAAARAGLLLRISEQLVLGPGADADAATVLTSLPQPFTTAEARKALGTTRRVAIPLLEFLDRARITERLPDDRRRLRPR
jgi:selenocysteine-specific elongation factor